MSLPASAAGGAAGGRAGGVLAPRAPGAAMDPQHRAAYVAAARLRRARRRDLDRMPTPSAVIVGAGIEGEGHAAEGEAPRKL